jgi:hypothetical protein
VANRRMCVRRFVGYEVGRWSKLWISGYRTTCRAGRTWRKPCGMCCDIGTDVPGSDEPRIARALEAAHTVRLELVRLPDTLHRAKRDARGLGHRRPVQCIVPVIS